MTQKFPFSGEASYRYVGTDLKPDIYHILFSAMKTERHMNAQQQRNVELNFHPLQTLAYYIHKKHAIHTHMYLIIKKLEKYDMQIICDTLK